MASSTTDDTFNMPFSGKPVVISTGGGSSVVVGGQYTESNKFESTVRQFSKQQSAGSTCSVANSVCSSTAATIGSLSTIITASSSNARNKRKKNFDEDDEDVDDQESSFSQFTADSSSDIMMLGRGGPTGLADVEIQANQDGSQTNLQ